MFTISPNRRKIKEQLYSSRLSNISASKIPFDQNELFHNIQEIIIDHKLEAHGDCKKEAFWSEIHFLFWDTFKQVTNYIKEYKAVFGVLYRRQFTEFYFVKLLKYNFIIFFGETCSKTAFAKPATKYSFNFISNSELQNARQFNIYNIK